MTDDPRSPTPRPGADADQRSESAAAADPVPRGGAGRLDEIASAVLDGEIGGNAAEAALRRPEVAARVAQLAAAREGVRSSVPPPDPARRESAIEAALAAYDAGEGVDDREAPVRGDELAAARGDRAVRHAGSGRHVRPARWIGAAAAVIVVAAVGLAMALSTRGSDQDVATSQADEAATIDATDPAASADAGEGADRATADDSAESDGAADTRLDAGSAAPEASGAPYAGAFASAQELLDAVGDTAAQGAAGTDAAALTALRDRCTAGVPAVIAAGGDEARLLAWGAVDGDRVEVWLGGDGGDRQLVAVDTRCSAVATRPAG